MLRRLNRVEYDNTVRDLMNTSLRPGAKLPQDESSGGFDTMGEALSFTQLHLEQMEAGATAVVDELFARPVGSVERNRVLSCELTPGAEAACAREIVTAFMPRVFRRPVESAEVERALGVVNAVVAAGFSHEEGVKAALRGVLLSPHFIYRFEGSVPNSPAPFTLDNYELATRLSYFLWSSTPDDALLAAAAAPAPLDVGREAARLLAHPKVSALLDDFVGQWLTLRDLSFQADPAVFPDFDVAVPDDAAEETRLFFRTLLDENEPLESLLLADFSVLNARLATHYQISAGSIDGFARVSLGDVPRIGLLTQASFLMRTSLPARTSPVVRGAWVMERMLCSPPDPVPPDLVVDDLAAPQPGSGTTLREALEAHRADPVCAGCHSLMDPIGLGLENYDAMGRYRTTENGANIDASGTIEQPSGIVEQVSFRGALELAPILAADPRFAACMAEHLLSYAVGRPFSTPSAKSYVAALAERIRAAGRGNWRDWLLAMVSSEAFTTGRGEAP